MNDASAVMKASLDQTTLQARRNRFRIEQSEGSRDPASRGYRFFLDLQ
jgi:hypothetical protein